MSSNTIIVIITISATVLIFLFKICFASKCERVSLCFGLLNIDREVQLENKEFRNGTTSPQLTKQIENVLDKSILPVEVECKV